MRMDEVPFVAAEGARSPLLFLLAGVSFSLTAFPRRTPFMVAAFLAPLTVWGLLLLFSERRPSRFFPYASALSFLALLMSLFCCYGLIPESTSPSGMIRDEGTVILERPWGGRRAVLVDASSGRYLLKLAPNLHVQEGNRLSFTGYATIIRSRPDSSFQEDLYWRARGTSLEIMPESLSRKDGGFSLSRWRTALRKRILLVFPPRVRGYLLAALLGVRDPDLAEAHRRWGTSHLLAVSGFHVGLVVLGAWSLLSMRKMRDILPRRAALLAVSGLLWFYTLLAGGAPGAFRAALMIQALFVGKLLGRKGSPLNSVSLAAIILLLWRPDWFFDVGWRLSVIAALLLSALAERRLAFWILPASSLFVWLATFPQISATFGEAPIAGMLLNLAALPLFSVLYPLCCILALPSLLGIPGGWLPAGIAEGLFLLWEQCADTASSILPWNLSWHPLFAAIGGGIFILTVAGGVFPLRGRTVAGAGIFLLSAVLVG